MTYVQPHLITAHAPAPRSQSGSDGARAAVTPSGTPTAHWTHDAQGNRVFFDPNRQQANPVAGTKKGGPNGMSKPASETEYGGFLVGPLGQRYEVKPGQKLEDIAREMGVRTDDGFGGKGFTGMKVLRGFDSAGNPVTRLVPNSASHSGTGSISFSETNPDGSDSAHGLTFIPNNPAAAVRDVSGGGGGGGRSGGFTAGDYAKMRAQADIQGERDERQHQYDMERMQQQSLLRREYEVVQANKSLAAKEGEANLLRKDYEKMMNPSGTLLFPDAPQQETPQPQKGSGNVSIRPAADLQKQIDDAMSVLDGTLRRMKSKIGIPADGIAKSGGDGSLLDAFEASIGASPVGQQQASASSAPVGPLSEFWQYDGGADGGNVGNAERLVASSYADTLGGVIDMFTMNPQEVIYG